MGKRRPRPLTAGGLIRKCTYLDPLDADRLRRAAFRLERSESDLLRTALLDLLDTVEEPDPKGKAPA